MDVVLVIFRPDGQRLSFSVAQEMTVIGRGEDCDLRIALLEVSRKHCRILKDETAVRVEDLGSSNGTLLNGQRLLEAELKRGDVIQVGAVRMVVQIDGQPAEDQISAEVREPAAATEDSFVEDQTPSAGEDEEDDLIEFDPHSSPDGADQTRA